MKKLFSLLLVFGMIFGIFLIHSASATVIGNFTYNFSHTINTGSISLAINDNQTNKYWRVKTQGSGSQKDYFMYDQYNPINSSLGSGNWTMNITVNATASVNYEEIQNLGLMNGTSGLWYNWQGRAGLTIFSGSSNGILSNAYGVYGPAGEYPVCATPGNNVSTPSIINLVLIGNSTNALACNLSVYNADGVTLRYSVINNSLDSAPGMNISSMRYTGMSVESYLGTRYIDANWTNFKIGMDDGTGGGDTTYPQFSNILYNVTNNTAYVFGKSYNFSVNILNTNGTAGINLNGVNYTLTNSSNNFNYTFGGLSAGTYNFSYWAYGNGTSKNYNSTSNYSYTVALGNSTLGMSLTTTTPITYGTNSSFSGAETNNGDGGCSYSLNNSNKIFGAGVVWFNYSTAGCANYSSGYVLNFTTINKATPTLTFLANGGTSNLTLNYGQTINISAYASTGTVNLEKDGVNFSVNNTLNVVLPYGSYLFRANITGNANYSDVGYSYFNITYNSLPSVTILYPTAITYNQNVSQINYSVSDPQGLSMCWYSTDNGATNSTPISAGTNFTDIVSFSGSNTWKVYCNNTANKVNSSSVAFSLNKLWYTTNPTNVSSFRITQFINRSGSNFTLGGQQYRIIGADSYYLADYATNHTYDDDGNEINGSRQYVTEILNSAHSLGINVIRTWCGMSGGGSSTNWANTKYGGHYNLFEVGTPGNYSESMFSSFDWLVSEASKRDIRLQCVFINNWDEYGGMNWYNHQSPTVNQTFKNITDNSDANWWVYHDQYYTNNYTMNYTKNYINYFLNRNNTITGVKYKNDPTFFSWMIVNEPRVKIQNANRSILPIWTKNMTAYIKSIDSNHLVALGIEGLSYNETWGEGTDINLTQNGTGVDYATFALHPAHWDYFALRGETSVNNDWICTTTGGSCNIGNPKFANFWVNGTNYTYNNRYSSTIPVYSPQLARHGYDNWVQQNAKWCNQLGLPCLLQEMSIDQSFTDSVKTYMYNNAIHNFYSNGGDGIMYWTLNHPNYYYSTQNSSYSGKMDDGYAFYVTNDATLKAKSNATITSFNFAKTDNNGSSWVTALNNYKYDFDINVALANNESIQNCSLNLNIYNGTNRNVTIYNSSEVIPNTNYVFSYQLLSSDINFTWYSSCCSGNVCYNSNFTSTQVSGNPPIINLINPQNNSYSTNTINFQYNVSDVLDISFCQLYVNNTLLDTNYIVLKDTTQTFSETLSSNIANYSWYVSCTDTSSNVGTSVTRNVFVDTIAPSAVLLSPPNNSFSNNLTQNFTANLTDNIGIANATINVYNASNATQLINKTTVIYVSGTLTTTVGIVVSLVDGIYNWFVNLFDWAGNSYTTGNNTVTIDTTIPKFTTIPANQSVTYGTGLGVQFNATDLYFSSYYLGNWTNKFQINSTGYLSNTSDLSAGTYLINVSINDSAGNTNMTWYNLTINKASTSVSLTATTPITYGTTTNFIGSGCQDGSCTLNITNQVYPAGYITANYSFIANQNYSASSSVFTVIINKDSSSLDLKINGTSSNFSIKTGSSVNITCLQTKGDSGTIISEYNNGTLLSNKTSPLSNLTNFNLEGLFNITCIYPSTQNYSSSQLTYFINSGIFPQFSNYSDNSGNLTDTGIGYFNTTIEDTNGTAYLNINGQNILATNISNIYSVNYTFTSGGSYNYNWFAYGNGSYHGMNTSEIKTYIVNTSSTNTQQPSGGGGGTTSISSGNSLLLCNDVYYFIINHLNNGNVSYSNSEYTSLKNKIAIDSKINLTDYQLNEFINSYSTTCQAINGLVLPSSIKKINVLNINNTEAPQLCNLTSNYEGFFSKYMPFFKITLNSDCDSIENKNILFHISKNGNYYIDGLRIWWLVIIILLSVAFYFLKVRTKKN